MDAENVGRPDAGQTWSPRDYSENGGFVPALGVPVLELLAAQPGERILDLGCGDGLLTERIVVAGAEVVGCDASSELLAVAAGRGLDVRLADGNALPFSAEFDAVFSNAALHWMRHPHSVVAGVRKALRPGGRFVGEFGGHGNIAAIVTALLAVLSRRGVDVSSAAMPWYFPTAEEYRSLLESNGFIVDSMSLFPRPTVLPTDMAGWLATFGEPFVNRLPAGERPIALAEAEKLLAPSLRDRDGRWTADYVRLRFSARLGRATRPLEGEDRVGGQELSA